MQNNSINFCELSPASLWILSRFQNCQEKVNLSIQNLDFSEVVDALYRFLWDDFANWYVEFLKTDNTDLAFARVLFGHFVVLISPFAPFVADKLWTDFFGSSELLAKTTTLELTKLCKLLTIEEIKVLLKNNSEVSPANSIQEFENLVLFIKEIRSVRGLFGIDPGFVLTIFANFQTLSYAKFLKHLAKCETKLEGEADIESESSSKNLINSQNLEQVLETKIGAKLEYINKNKDLEISKEEKEEKMEKAEKEVQKQNFEGCFKIKVGEFVAKLDLKNQINPKKQIQKSQKELENLEKQVQNLQNQLANSDFMNRASSEIIQEKWENLAARKMEIETQTQKIKFLKEFAQDK